MAAIEIKYSGGMQHTIEIMVRYVRDLEGYGVGEGYKALREIFKNGELCPELYEQMFKVLDKPGSEVIIKNE